MCLIVIACNNVAVHFWRDLLLLILGMPIVRTFGAEEKFIDSHEYHEYIFRKISQENA